MTIDFDSIAVGDSMPSYTSKPITRAQLARYAGASGDFNPLHTDETFARAIGLDSVIAHGMFISHCGRSRYGLDRKQISEKIFRAFPEHDTTRQSG